MHLSHLTRFTLNAFAAATALLVVGCGESGRDSAWWHQEEERIGLEHQLELKKFRFDQVFSNDFNELQSLKKSTTEVSASLNELRSQKKELTAAVESLESQWGEFRRTAILEQRQRASGKVFEEMTLASGRSFQKVFVSSIDDGGVTIRHADGSAKLRFDDLNAEQRLFFGLEEDLAKVARDEEAQNAVAYERWIDTRLVAMNEQKQKHSAIERREEIAEQKARASSMASARDLLAANTSPLAQPAKSFASVRSNRYYSYRYRSYRTYTPFYRACYRAPRSYSSGSQMHYLKTGQMQGATPTPNF